jgi:serine/threonine protein kinase
MPAPLSPERWHAASPYLDRALELEGEDRAALLAALRRKDARLATDLETLLGAHDAVREQGFLDEALLRAQPAASLEGQVLGAYTLRAPLGRGGMGSVWLADRSDGRFRGEAAVKLLNPSLVGRDGEGRFRREGSILARLRHAHIAQLIDAGVSPQGQPYLVLERVDGERLDAYCDTHGLGVDARVRLFLGVLAAVAHAHANLVVHRDLKPSNVLVDADGQVKLLDFGIAKLLAAGDGDTMALTRDGEALLTPEYAAPEQLTGGDVTTATDVYALGVLLYVLLAGRHPARNGTQTPADLVRAVVDTEAERLSEAATTGAQALERAGRRGSTPRRLRGALRGDLDNIVAKALKKRPAERYASAEAMAEDLRRYLDHLPVRARADSLGYRARKFAWRHRVVLAAAGAVVLALGTGAGIAVRQARASARERDRALVELRRSEGANDFIGFLLSEATPRDGRPVTNEELLALGDAIVDRRYADDPAARVHMLLILADRYQENQQHDRLEATVERAFATSRGITDVGLRSRAACARAQALVDQAPGDAQVFHTADGLLSEALAELGARGGSAADEAYCRVREANLANRRGDHARSVPAAERAVTLEEERRAPVARRFEAGLALANAYLVAGRGDSAEQTYGRLMTLLESQGLAQSRDATLVLNNWNSLWYQEGQYLRALPLSERALRIGRARATERGAVAPLLRRHASILCAVGRCREAAPLIEEAVAKARSEASPRRLAATLQSAATVFIGTGDLERAAAALREVEALLTADAATAPGLYAALDAHLARLSLARGDTAATAALAQRGLARPGEKNWDTVALRLVLAEAENRRGDFATARAAAEESLKLLQEWMGERGRNALMGRAHLELGTALAGQGDTNAARAELERAVAHLEVSAGPDAPTTRRARARRDALGSPP